MVMFLLYVLLLITIGGLMWAGGTIWGLIISRGVPFVPLRGKQLKDIRDSVTLDAGDRVVDIGCGDGRILRFFQRQYGVTDLTGYEINFWALWKAKVLNKIFKSPAKVYCHDFFKEDFSRYNVVFCYLLPGCLLKLRDKFDKELKPGTRIISYAFEIKNWRTPEVIYCDKENQNRSRIFIYTI